jgi:hypothetical protein
MPDACIVSHQLRTTAFSTLGGFGCNGDWHWTYEFRRGAGDVDQYQGDRQVRRHGGVVRVLRYRPGVMDIEPRGVKKRKKKEGVMRLGDIQNGQCRRR